MTSDNKTNPLQGSSVQNVATVATVGRMDPFIPGEDFEVYIKRLKMYFIANGIPENLKAAVLITVMGNDTFQILDSLFSPEDPCEKTFDQIVDKLKKQFKPMVIVAAERYKLYTRKQKVNEPIAEYVVALKHLAQSCNFGAFLADALRDAFIIGIQDHKIRRRLLSEELDFDKAYKIASGMELANVEETKLNVESGLNHVVSRQKNVVIQSGKRVSGITKQGVDEQKVKYCARCGRANHAVNKCPAANVVCFKCRLRGHFANMCRTRNIHLLQEGGADECEDESVDVISWVAEGNDPLLVSVDVEGKKVTMEIDSGACKSIISEQEYREKFNHVSLKQGSKSFQVITGQRFRPLGVGEFRVRLRDTNTVIKLEMSVVSSECRFRPLLGRSWLNALYPGWKRRVINSELYEVNTIKKGVIEPVTKGTGETSVNFQRCGKQEVVNENKCDFLKTLQESYPRAFSEDSSVPIKDFEVDIILNEHTPVFHKAYELPFKMREPVEEELNRMVSVGILKPVKHSRYASPIVAVPKSDGKSIRVCVDCKRTINPFVQTEHYPLPRIDDILASFPGCKVFCVLDLKGAYQQLALSEESKKYLTINTHKGLFQFQRLCYGVSSAPSIFQQVIDQILRGLKFVKSYIDDTLIGGENFSDCLNNLKQVLERLNMYNVHVNLAKCSFFTPQVDYLGHTLSEKGLSPNSDKVKAIVQAPSPTNSAQL